MKRATLLLVLLLVVGVMSADAGLYRAVASGRWDSTGTWTGATGFPAAGDDAVIGGGFTVTVKVNSACANLTVGKATGSNSGNGLLFVNSGVTLSVSGNFTNGDGAAIGTVQFQTSGSGLLDVGGVLSYANASSTFSGYSAIRRVVNGTGKFVFESSTDTLLATTSQPSQTVMVQTYPNTFIPTGNTALAIKRYYTITPSGTLTATLRLAYSDPSEINGLTEANFSAWRYTGTSWVDQGGAVVAASNYVEVTGVSTWSNWTIAESGSPLPIQLASFTATTLSTGQVRLNWTTLTETNNYGFEVQKSANTPTNYQTIANSFVPGHGTTVVPQYYTFTDVNATPGHWYYRLKQIDLDGTVHYSDGTQVDILTGVGEEGTIPASYEVSQNYPNPFNPSTTIQFATPERGHVTLKVFNLLGQEVATLVNGEFAAGYHNVQWNASAMASGVYLYQLKAGSFVETRKLTLTK